MKKVILIILLFSSAWAWGQTSVQGFNLLSVVDGKGYSLESYSTKAWVVIFY